MTTREPRPTVRLRWFPGDVSLEIPLDEAFIDAVDYRREIDLPMACRAANCGTCRVRILSGASGVIPPDDWERKVLAEAKAEAGERLACQLRFSGDPACPEIVLERAY